jgi:hypothetical protein
MRPTSVEFASIKAASGFRIGRAYLGVARRAISAMLLSAIVTIVTSRVSETSLPIKVSVSDVWGAVTLGFIAFFVGDKFIKWLTGLGTDDQSKDKKRDESPLVPKPKNQASKNDAPKQEEDDKPKDKKLDEAVLAPKQEDQNAKTNEPKEEAGSAAEDQHAGANATEEEPPPEEQEGQN